MLRMQEMLNMVAVVLVGDAKKNILFSFEEDLVIDTKKILFEESVSLQQFFTFLIHRLVLGDPNATHLLKEAALFNKATLEGSDKEKIKKIDKNALYDLFEQEDKQKEE